MGELFLGVDVGTGSARAGLFDGTGRLVGVSKQSIRVWHEPGGIVEQSSSDIWWACGEAIRGALASANARAADVVGVGFDATCSLVVVDPEGRPVAAGPSGDDMRNVIVWMDHRATAEADLINAGHHEVLNYVGGRISPEMQPPKLLWLKRNIPKAFRRAGHFFDLSDFLTWKATGSTTRSICTVTCKWSYLAHERRWDAEFFTAIGLEDFPQEGFRQIGQTMALPGSAIGGITEQAALELGLLPGTPVGCSLIDAHAGAIGTIGSRDAEGGIPDPTERLALIMGTSACIMATTRQACFVPGLWGPYFEALLPGFWLNEGGQSAWGAAIDYLMRHHASWGEVCRAATAEGLDPLESLERRILKHWTSLSAVAYTARNLHVLPDFLGNRSPFADANVRGAVLGLDLDGDIASLERLYVAGLCGLGYATAEVVEALAAKGVAAHTMVVSGGASRSPLVRQVIADTTGLTIGVSGTPEPVLLGSAMLGAVAAGRYSTIEEAMPALSSLAGSVTPAKGEVATFHEAKRRVFDQMRAADRLARATMA